MLVPSRSLMRSRTCRIAKYVSGRIGERSASHSGSDCPPGFLVSRYRLISKKASGGAGTYTGTVPPFGTTLALST